MDREVLRKRLLATFQAEAHERLIVLADIVATWSANVATVESLEAVFREVHSLKGAARAVGLEQFEAVCHAWESLLAELKSDPSAFTVHDASVSRHALKVVRQLYAQELVSNDEFAEVLRLLAFASAQKSATEETHPQTTPRKSPVAQLSPEVGSVRVSGAQLDALHSLAEGALQLRLEAVSHLAGVEALLRRVNTERHRVSTGQSLLTLTREKLSTIEPRFRSQLKDLLSLLEWQQGAVTVLQNEVTTLANTAKALSHSTYSFSKELVNELHSTMLVPATTLTQGILLMVEDIAEKSGKRVELTIRVGDLQLDKRMIDELKLVITHLIRNSIDHGIEPPDSRIKLSKKPVGVIDIEMVQESADRFTIVLKDDGAGIDVESLKERAVSQGRLTKDQANGLNAAESLGLIFESGLSTSRIISEISGRGIGMSIVQEKVERLGGRVEVENNLGQGVSFRINLPANISAFRIVLVRTGGATFGMPALAVDRCITVEANLIERVKSRPVVIEKGEVLALWSLAELLGKPAAALDSQSKHCVLVMKVRGVRFALIVEDILGDQEVTIKSLGRQLRRVKSILGATVLGDGQLIPVLHPGDLLDLAQKTVESTLTRPSAVQRAGPQRLLIAEDSFTSRGLLTSILEGAGYEVVAVSDGLEAWNMLRQDKFDLLVSDVEMPRMDGFTLTERVRNDRNLSELPVILVTALQSPEDRSRGLEVGANAYLVKSGFEQDSLLDAIHHLI